MVAETTREVRSGVTVVDDVRAYERVVVVAGAELDFRAETVVLQGERGRGRVAQKRQSGKRGDGEERFFAGMFETRAPRPVNRFGGGG